MHIIHQLKDSTINFGTAIIINCCGLSVSGSCGSSVSVWTGSCGLSVSVWTGCCGLSVSVWTGCCGMSVSVWRVSCGLSVSVWGVSCGSSVSGWTECDGLSVSVRRNASESIVSALSEDDVLSGGGGVYVMREASGSMLTGGDTLRV